MHTKATEIDRERVSKRERDGARTHTMAVATDRWRCNSYRLAMCANSCCLSLPPVSPPSLALSLCFSLTFPYFFSFPHSFYLSLSLDMCTRVFIFAGLFFTLPDFASVSFGFWVLPTEQNPTPFLLPDSSTNSSAESYYTPAQLKKKIKK